MENKGVIFIIVIIMISLKYRGCMCEDTPLMLAGALRDCQLWRFFFFPTLINILGVSHTRYPTPFYL